MKEDKDWVTIRRPDGSAIDVPVSKRLPASLYTYDVGWGGVSSSSCLKPTYDDYPKLDENGWPVDLKKQLNDIEDRLIRLERKLEVLFERLG